MFVRAMRRKSLMCMRIITFKISWQSLYWCSLSGEIQDNLFFNDFFVSIIIIIIMKMFCIYLVINYVTWYSTLLTYGIRGGLIHTGKWMDETNLRCFAEWSTNNTTRWCHYLTALFIWIQLSLQSNYTLWQLLSW